MACSTNKLVTLLFVIAFSAIAKTEAQGLKLEYYRKTCPQAEFIIAKTTYEFVSRKPSLAASLLRLHFHDCFVRGCDASVLLDPTPANKQTEKTAGPNLSLKGYEVVDAAKREVEKICPLVVSCADILALVARNAVQQIYGPSWDVPTGRKDGKVSNAVETFTNLPPPFGNITTLKAIFASKGLNSKDLVVLSGGHTIGVSHCSSFVNRLYNFTGKGDTDPSMDPLFAANLKKICSPTDTTTLVAMDPTFKKFDTEYFSAVASRRGLFESDAALLKDRATRDYVAQSQTIPGGFIFSRDFATSMVKMGKIGVITGNNTIGEIRAKCAFVNPLVK